MNSEYRRCGGMSVPSEYSCCIILRCRASSVAAAACFIEAAVDALHYTVDPQLWKTTGENEEVKRRLVQAVRFDQERTSCV